MKKTTKNVIKQKRELNLSNVTNNNLSNRNSSVNTLIQAYNVFHKNTSSTKKVINNNNYTYKRILEILFENVRSNKLRVLDFGCGVGSISLYLGKAGHQVTGVDISTRAIDSAIQSSTYTGLTSNVKFLTLSQWKKSKKYKYDLVLCLEVIEHVPSDLDLVRSLADLLNPDGILIISTPSNRAPLYRLGLTMEFDKKVGHLRRYDSNMLRDLIKKSGLSIERIYYEEGIIRNSLFLLKPLTFIIRLIRGPFVTVFTVLDRLTIPIFGYSDFVLITKKQ